MGPASTPQALANNGEYEKRLAKQRKSTVIINKLKIITVNLSKKVICQYPHCTTYTFFYKKQ